MKVAIKLAMQKDITMNNFKSLSWNTCYNDLQQHKRFVKNVNLFQKHHFNILNHHVSLFLWFKRGIECFKIIFVESTFTRVRWMTWQFLKLWCPTCVEPTLATTMS
jgi:hypothetical protein